jgi:tetratricopeptide (TPR) repeat protein
VTERLLSTTKLFENIVLLTIAAALIALFAAIVALAERHFAPEPQVLIGKFSVLNPTGKPGDNTALGDIVANQLSDALDQTIVSGAAYKGNPYASSKWHFKPLEVPVIPVSRDFDLSWKGVSLSQITAAWDFVRHQQQRISGDILAASDAAGSTDQTPMWVIHARMGGSFTAEWTSKPFALNQASLKIALQDLAQQIITSTNPELAGRFFLSRQNPWGAAAAFLQWVQAEPQDPVANAWLGRAFYLEMNNAYDPVRGAAAEGFADDALRLLGNPDREPSPGRRRVAYQIAHTVLGNDARLEAEAMPPGPQRDKLFTVARQHFMQIPNDPASSINLGVVDYRGFHDPAKALRDDERAIQQEGKEYPGAWTNMASVWLAQNDFRETARNTEEALRFNPLFPNAIEVRLEGLIRSNQFQAAQRYCSQWLAPFADGQWSLAQVSEPLTPQSFFWCARAESALPSPDILRTVLYLDTGRGERKRFDGPGRTTLQVVATSLCSRNGTPRTDPLQKQALEMLITWLQAEDLQAKEAVCAQFAGTTNLLHASPALKRADLLPETRLPTGEQLGLAQAGPKDLPDHVSLVSTAKRESEDRQQPVAGPSLGAAKRVLNAAPSTPVPTPKMGPVDAPIKVGPG